MEFIVNVGSAYLGHVSFICQDLENDKYCNSNSLDDIASYCEKEDIPFPKEYIENILKLSLIETNGFFSIDPEKLDKSQPISSAYKFLQKLDINLSHLDLYTAGATCIQIC